MTTAITSLRTPGDIRRDRAVLDLLQLQELGQAPGQVTTAQLRLLWRCSQPQVSRRLAAINSLPGWRVQWQSGRGAAASIDHELPPPPPPTARERWERLRRGWAG
jgi:hypothetical protein